MKYIQRYVNKFIILEKEKICYITCSSKLFLLKCNVGNYKNKKSIPKSNIITSVKLSGIPYPTNQIN